MAQNLNVANDMERKNALNRGNGMSGKTTNPSYKPEISQGARHMKVVKKILSNLWPVQRSFATGERKRGVRSGNVGKQWCGCSKSVDEISTPKSIDG